MSAPADRLARLDDYVSAHMDDGVAAAFEEELFEAAADEDAAGAAAGDAVGDAAFLDSLARMSAMLASVGGLAGGGTRAQVDAIRAAGTKVHYYELSAERPSTVPNWAAGTQVVVARLDVDLRGYENIDVEVQTGDGRPVKTFRDVACDPADGALYAICQEPLARLAFQRGRTVSRVVATRAGQRATVAVFDIRPA